MQKKIVTISRQYGSGGRYIGLFVSVIKVRDFLLSGTSLDRSAYRQHLCETV